MKKLLTALLAITIAASMNAQKAAEGAAPAAGGAPGVVVLKDGKSVDTEALDADAQGNITYKEGKFTAKKKRNEYKEAYLKNEPKEIAEAKKLMKSNALGAASAFAAAFPKYQYLGFDVACIFGEGKGYADGGKKDQAIAALERLLPLKGSIGDKKEKDFGEGLKLLQSLYIEKKDYAKADQIGAVMGGSQNEAMAFAGLMNRGKMLEDQGKVKDAVLMYMRCSLLYPKDMKERDVAIFNVARIMKATNDARWQDWSKMLQEQYPDSKFAKQL